jgi:hypothetical protein
MDDRRRTALLGRVSYALTRLILGACALLAAISIAFGMNGRWHGWVAATLWIVLGAVAFRYLWHQPERKH